MLESKFCWFAAKFACFDTPEGWWVVVVVGNSDIKANSVQLLLQLPTGTELGKKSRYHEGGGALHEMSGDKEAAHEWGSK